MCCIFPRVIRINTTFANFTGLYFPQFTTFRNQTLQFTNFNMFQGGDSLSLGHLLRKWRTGKIPYAAEMGDSSYKLNFDLGKKNKIQHHS
jgi:hypothetical protein